MIGPIKLHVRSTDGSVWILSSDGTDQLELTKAALSDLGPLSLDREVTMRDLDGTERLAMMSDAVALAQSMGDRRVHKGLLPPPADERG